jgi:hypothetical protein
MKIVLAGLRTGQAVAVRRTDEGVEVDLSGAPLPHVIDLQLGEQVARWLKNQEAQRSAAEPEAREEHRAPEAD